MSRELRRVPADWQHPKDERGHYRPLYDASFADQAAEWKEGFAAWERGERPDYCDADYKGEFWEWDSGPPDRESYRPNWTEEQMTHFQMYETCSEGTPISPVFDTIEKVARWCADNRVSAFADMTATYEQWLATCRQGASVGSFCFDAGTGEITSGVAAAAELKRDS